MIASRAAAVRTVYKVDQVPSDGFLMRFCRNMLFGGAADLETQIRCSHRLPCCADDVVYMQTFMRFRLCSQMPDIYAD